MTPACETCAEPVRSPDALRLSVRRRSVDFCSLGCLSSWVEAQRLIALVSDRP